MKKNNLENNIIIRITYKTGFYLDTSIESIMATNSICGYKLLTLSTIKQVDNVINTTCSFNAHMIVSENTALSKDIVCCKKHLRSVCIDMINENKIFQILEKVIVNKQVTYVSYPITNVKKLPHQMHIHTPPRDKEVDLNLTPVLEQGQHQCCICFDDTEDVYCSTNRHVMCISCFNGHVQSEAHRQEFNCSVKCPFHRMKECDCSGFSMYFIAKTVDENVFNEFDRKRNEVNEKSVISQYQTEIAEQEKLDQMLSQYEKDRHYVLSDIMTLHCPMCSLSYYDFNGCAAVTCYGCKAEFCGKCHYVSNSKILNHKHCNTCSSHNVPKGLFINETVIKHAQNNIRLHKLIEFFLGKENRFTVLESLTEEFKEIELPVEHILKFIR